MKYDSRRVILDLSKNKMLIISHYVVDYMIVI
ncbi:hypothetical protein J5U23_01487 [Saccharolobus shibatae B12]|uniref:Uncharacterized protein n=2 Tax=Saccharolobus shibatae TaxID=2286 RepID=A0A8F5GWH1_9CREN|nr:hypothetical protein J5U23_01487 [Saccharolobus shibatae B12]QXJ31996.1 hypothetical protein J5U21_01647 [Saccharolobus shibatae]QXJ34987.1 hypothetical protein J5U22_01534 [Saccharolobus shibatae]